MKHICIYCKKEKSEEEFNREHVVPQMMGRYTDGLVLSEFQVCQECNSFFSKQIEDKISLDSYEALLRMKSGTKKMSDGRRLRNSRLTLIGAEGLFKGLRFCPVSKPDTPERVAFEIMPCVGLKISDSEYEYYTIDDLPDSTDDVMTRLRSLENPIIQFGYEQEVVEMVLRDKGYINDKSVYSEKMISQEYGRTDFLTSIRFSIDSIVRRVCAKTIFNYLCYNSSPEEMLAPKYDALRKYIRYGEWDDKLWFRYSIGYVSAATPPNDTSHVVGTMISFENGMCELLGCVTWFGEITYIIKICDVAPVAEHELGAGLTGWQMPKVETKFTYFDNETTIITEEEATFIYGGRNS